jgi:hypothetical protein
MTLALRAVIVTVMLTLWFLTQKLIAKRALDGEAIEDRIHNWTARWNQSLHKHPGRANTLLIISSMGIDALGLYAIGCGLFGPSITPLIGLIILFGLRQICQYLTALPPPPGLIWRNPGFPSLFVTYDVGNDLFFSAHTALTVYSAALLWETGYIALGTLGLLMIIFEVAIVLVLRAHWTLDVFAGAVTALLIYEVARRLGPFIDSLLVF